MSIRIRKPTLCEPGRAPCSSGKIQYVTPMDAGKAMRGINRKRGDVTDCYWCEECGAYHLTHASSKHV